MSNCCANSASVFSPLTAANATFALKAGVWFRRGRLVMVSPVRHAYWPLSGRNSTYPDVQISRASSVFMGDGGYDRTGVYTTLDERHPAAVIVVPPRADAMLSANAETDPTQRDCHIQGIAGKGRLAWQRDSGYNERARVEGQFARWKQVIGDGLRFHSDEARATEVAVAAQVLNRMLDLGRPNSVRVA